MSSGRDESLFSGQDGDILEVYDRMNSEERKYKVNAYVILLAALYVLLERRKDKTVHEHFSPAELARVFVELLKEKFGPYACSVMKSWGVSCSGDLGRMSYALQRVGLFALSDEDTQEKFETALDLEEAVSGEFKTCGPYPDVPGILDTLSFDEEMPGTEA